MGNDSETNKHLHVDLYFVQPKMKDAKSSMKYTIVKFTMNQRSA